MILFDKHENTNYASISVWKILWYFNHKIACYSKKCKFIRKIWISETPTEPKDVKVDDFDADFVDLVWKKPESDGGSPIVGYIIEKRDKYK